jgi:hypothetical protein
MVACTDGLYCYSDHIIYKICSLSNTYFQGKWLPTTDQIHYTSFLSLLLISLTKCYIIYNISVPIYNRPSFSSSSTLCVIFSFGFLTGVLFNIKMFLGFSVTWSWYSYLSYYTLLLQLYVIIYCSKVFLSNFTFPYKHMQIIPFLPTQGKSSPLYPLLTPIKVPVIQRPSALKLK